ncbi:N-acetylmuramoyl-L-alanine amidase [Haladaptatus pallidirubidus]|uniref:N-acetylmuramoyl-L-alanine amidase n=1 Tax=Haladaptatus pallidirubidus TaxID=1008152 RepID=A0AAV3UF38_9EURY|nr:peptidoglycan recognition family protein [Haladaptatus pallidirubidus]
MQSRRNLLKKIGAAGTAGLGAASLSSGTAAAKPAVDWVPAHSSNYTSANRGAANINAIVVHVAQGSAEGTVNWFTNPDANVSAHYTIRDDGYKYQSLSDINIGWHAGGMSWYNNETIGIEHGGYVSSGFTDAQYRSSAELVRWLCNQYNIPKSRVSGVANCYGESGIMGHHQVPETDCGYNDHTDPGPNWDWDYYMSLI